VSRPSAARGGVVLHRGAASGLVDQRKRHDDAKLKALKQAARQGWADVSAGGLPMLPVSRCDRFRAAS
jgi:hypothetical protein